MQLLLGLEKVDLNSTWFRSSLLIRYWGRMGPATPGIPPFGFKGSPMLLAKAGIKEMTEGKKPNNHQQQKTQLLPCPLPAPPPRNLCAFPLSPTRVSYTARRLRRLSSPQPPSTPPLQKRGPKLPPASTTSHLWVLPLSAPVHCQAQTHGHPRAPLLHGRADHGRRCRTAAGAGGCPRDCPHLAGASQLHSPPSQRRGYQAEFLKGSHPLGGFHTHYEQSLEPEALMVCPILSRPCLMSSVRKVGALKPISWQREHKCTEAHLFFTDLALLSTAALLPLPPTYQNNQEIIGTRTAPLPALPGALNSS